MVYITVRQPPMYHQMTLEEFLSQADVPAVVLNQNETNTRTYERDSVSNHMMRKLRISPSGLILKLIEFNENTAYLRSVPRHDLYREFHIPKKSGGLRKIDAPNPELMMALRRLKQIFEEDFQTGDMLLYHTSAFAYVKHRSTIDAMKRHQANESHWYAKYDLHNFFGSTTLDFIMHMFSMVCPFSEVIKTDLGREQLRMALELAILDGGLPQGTPISPLITNIMMIPVDFRLSNTLRDYGKQSFVYTRYADDFQVSSVYDFSYREIEKLIVDTLASFEAPFTINSGKTRYGSNSGSNYSLGVIVNKDNQISVGYKKKRVFKAMLSSFVLDTLHDNPWDLNDVQVLEGYRNYYRMVEQNTIDDIVSAIGGKYGVDVVSMLKSQLRM